MYLLLHFHLRKNKLNTFSPSFVNEVKEPQIIQELPNTQKAHHDLFYDELFCDVEKEMLLDCHPTVDIEIVH